MTVLHDDAASCQQSAPIRGGLGMGGNTPLQRQSQGQTCGMPFSPLPPSDSTANIQPSTPSQSDIPPSSPNTLSPVPSTVAVTTAPGETIVITVYDEPSQSRSGENTITSEESVGSISVMTEAVTLTSTPQHARRVSNGGVAGIAVAISIFLLLVLAGAWCIWNRRHHRRSSSGVSDISRFAPLTQRPDSEIQPAYPSTLRDTKLRPVSGKTGLPPLPEYGYTAREPQIHGESEIQST